MTPTSAQKVSENRAYPPRGPSRCSPLDCPSSRLADARAGARRHCRAACRAASVENARYGGTLDRCGSRQRLGRERQAHDRPRLPSPSGRPHLRRYATAGAIPPSIQLRGTRSAYGIAQIEPPQPSLSRLPGYGTAQDLVRAVRVIGSVRRSAPSRPL
jgi:hypothetical protein